MRDFVLQQSELRRAGSLRDRLARWRKNAKARQGVKVLLSLDDHGLRDIGLTRADVLALTRAPRDLDLEWEMERLRLSNSSTLR